MTPHAPWGYRLRQVTDAERRAGARPHVLAIDPVTAPFVREAFQRAAAGWPIAALAA